MAIFGRAAILKNMQYKKIGRRHFRALQRGELVVPPLCGAKLPVFHTLPRFPPCGIPYSIGHDLYSLLFRIVKRGCAIDPSFWVAGFLRPLKKKSG